LLVSGTPEAEAGRIALQELGEAKSPRREKALAMATLY
jgi:hypothetical protein